MPGAGLAPYNLNTFFERCSLQLNIMATARLFLCLSCALLTYFPQAIHSAAEPRYTNSWAVEVRGGAEAADQLAQTHGFLNLGQVSRRFVFVMQSLTAVHVLIMPERRCIQPKRGVYVNYCRFACVCRTYCAKVTPCSSVVAFSIGWQPPEFLPLYAGGGTWNCQEIRAASIIPDWQHAGEDQGTAKRGTCKQPSKI